jgi:glycosyltransferase involved in cell wall biosynthesis
MTAVSGLSREINVHLYPSPFAHETRILRITKSLVNAGVFNEVHVIASLRKNDMPEHEHIDESRQVWRIPTKFARRGLIGKTLNALEWSLRAFWLLRKQPIACINARTLSVLPVAVVLKKLKRCCLIYDVHEIETETPEVRGIRRILSKAAERFFIRSADAVAVTSEGHAAWYQSHYGLQRVWIVRNYPLRRPAFTLRQKLLREAFQLQDTDLLFLYQGVISSGRGIDLLLRVFRRLPHDRHIVFLGFGDNLTAIKESARLHPNIHFYPAVPPGELIKYTASADVGVHMMDDSCLNHLYALPNKPMEYLNAGIPALVSNLPEMGKLIEEAGAGWVMPVNDEQTLERFIRDLTREEIEQKAAHAAAWGATHTWEDEEQTLIELYRTLGHRASDDQLRNATTTTPRPPTEESGTEVPKGNEG